MKLRNKFNELKRRLREDADSRCGVISMLVAICLLAGVAFGGQAIHDWRGRQEAEKRQMRAPVQDDKQIDPTIQQVRKLYGVIPEGQEFYTLERRDDAQYCGLFHYVDEDGVKVADDFWVFFDKGTQILVTHPELEDYYLVSHSCWADTPFEKTIVYYDEPVNYVYDGAWVGYDNICDGKQPDGYSYTRLPESHYHGKHQPTEPPKEDYSTYR